MLVTLRGLRVKAMIMNKASRGEACKGPGTNNEYRTFLQVLNY